MTLFKLQGKKLLKIRDKPIDLEKDIQKVTEDNLNEIFGLKFIHTEFPIQNFRLDTVAFDDETKSFVIIEYKKEKNISVVDQALAYLSVMLNNKAEFILLYQEKTGINLKREEVDWSQSRIILIADSFTNYQENAIGFKDLPIELYEAKLYEGSLIFYNSLKSNLKRVATLKSIKQTKDVEDTLREIKEYTLEDHFKEDWKLSKRIFDKLKEETDSIDIINEKITKFYLAYSKEESNRSFFEIVAQKQGLKVYLRPMKDELRSPHLHLYDCSKMGHWTNGNTYFVIDKIEDVPYALDLIKQTYDLVYPEM